MHEFLALCQPKWLKTMALHEFASTKLTIDLDDIVNNFLAIAKRDRQQVFAIAKV